MLTQAFFVFANFGAISVVSPTVGCVAGSLVNMRADDVDFLDLKGFNDSPTSDSSEDASDTESTSPSAAASGNALLAAIGEPLDSEEQSKAVKPARVMLDAQPKSKPKGKARQMAPWAYATKIPGTPPRDPPPTRGSKAPSPTRCPPRSKATCTKAHLQKKAPPPPSPTIDSRGSKATCSKASLPLPPADRMLPKYEEESLLSAQIRGQMLSSDPRTCEQYVNFEQDNPQMEHTMQTAEAWMAAKKEAWDPWRRSTWDEELTPSAHPLASSAASPMQPSAAAMQGPRQPSGPPPASVLPPPPPAASVMQPNKALPPDKRRRTDDASPNAVADSVEDASASTWKSKRQLQREQGRHRPASARTQWHRSWWYWKHEEGLADDDIRRLIGPCPQPQPQAKPNACDAAPSNPYHVARE